MNAFDLPLVAAIFGILHVYPPRSIFPGVVFQESLSKSTKGALAGDFIASFVPV